MQGGSARGRPRMLYLQRPVWVLRGWGVGCQRGLKRCFWFQDRFRALCLAPNQDGLPFRPVVIVTLGDGLENPA